MTRSSLSDSRETTPSPAPIPKKKKTPKKNELKWFKGSANRNRTPKKLLKHAQRDSSPQLLPIPARIVEFDIDGHTERLGVCEILSVVEKETKNYDLPQMPDTTDESSNSVFPNSPFPATPGASSSKPGKGKGALKRPKLNRNQTPKITTNRNNNWNISENSESNSNSLNNKLPEGVFSIMDDYKPKTAPPMPNSYIRYMETRPEELENEVEYDIDEEDIAWLELANEKRRSSKLLPVAPEDMEFLLDRLEKESYFQMQSTGMEQAPLIDDDAVCCICMDGECQNSNAILFCDMCNLAVHQECYGVPYIPEGQWLCRRCLNSPSRAVDCVLCPNKGGAFKGTDDGRWAHVICAIWIPEVCFANTVFLEPIDSVSNIPAARWKLSCYICKQKGVGACIQCQKSNCYTAFHVTCAQQANLCMSMDQVVEGNSVIVKKTAYCDHHAPPVNERVDDSPRQKLKQTRKLLAEKRCAIPVVSIPTIPNERINEIAEEMQFQRKRQFIKRLMAYWKLKRQERNGVPLLRRLQAASSSTSSVSKREDSRPTSSSESTTLNYYHYWVRMRQDLEKGRLLCELIRKRERLKKAQIHIKHQEVNLSLKPFNCILLNVVQELMARDVSEIFCEPVDTKEVVDYLNVIKKPMDLSTIKEKINSFEYSTIDELERDFDLMVQNCLMYNGKDTIYYKAGLRLRELGGVVIRQARRLINSIGFDKETGMHLEERVSELPVLEDREILQKVENFMESEERFKLPLPKHIEELQNLMDETLALTHPLKRKNRFSRVRSELIRIRKLKNFKDPVACFKEYNESKHNSLFLTDTDPSSIPMLNCDPAIELFRVGVSPKKRQDSETVKEADSIPAIKTRTPVTQRCKSRSLRPLKRKILTESPLKDSPVKESPTSVTPPKLKTYRTSTPRIVKTPRKVRRNSVSPTRKSQRISSVHLQVEAHTTPIKSNVSPANKRTPSPPKYSKRTSSPDITAPICKDANVELTEDNKTSNFSTEGKRSTSPYNSPERDEVTFSDYDDDGDFHDNHPPPRSRTPSPSPSMASKKSSSGSSISSLIRFDAPDIRFDRLGTHHEPGTIPILVTPTRPIEVISNYSSDNSTPRSARSVLIRKGLAPWRHGALFMDLTPEHSGYDTDSPTKSQCSNASDTTDTTLTSPSSTSRKVETNSNNGRLNPDAQTPESQKLKPANKRSKSAAIPNTIPASSNRRVISFTDPSPLKASPISSKSPAVKKLESTAAKQPREQKVYQKRLQKTWKLSDNEQIDIEYIEPCETFCKIPKSPLTSPKRGRPRKIPKTLSPGKGSTSSVSPAKSLKAANLSPRNSPKKSGSKVGSPTKSAPSTPNNRIPKKRLSTSDVPSSKQKKAKLVTSGKARLSRSLSQSEFRTQSRSPSITSLVCSREPAGGNRNRPIINNDRVKPKAQIQAQAPVRPITPTPSVNSFKAYRGAQQNEVDSNSDEESGAVNECGGNEDKGAVGKNVEEELDPEKVNETESQNGISEPNSLAKPYKSDEDSAPVDSVDRNESFPKESKYHVNALGTSTAINIPSLLRTVEVELNVFSDVNANERVPGPESPSLSPESDLLDPSDEDEFHFSSQVMSKCEAFRPQPLDLVWAVYEFKSWFPAMVINPDGPFGLVDGLRIHQPPAEILSRKPNVDPVFLVSYFETKHHWKWVERNQLNPLGSDHEIDQFFLVAKSILDLKEVKKAYERAILIRCRVDPNETVVLSSALPPPLQPVAPTPSAPFASIEDMYEDDDTIGELLDIN